MAERTNAERINAAAEWITARAEKAGEIRKNRESYLRGTRNRLRTEDGAIEEAELEMAAADRPRAKGQATPPLMPPPFIAVDGPQNRADLEPEAQAQAQAQALANEQATTGRHGPERAADLESRVYLPTLEWVRERGGLAWDLLQRCLARLGPQALEGIDRDTKAAMLASYPAFRKLGEAAWKNSCLVDDYRRAFLEGCASALRKARAEVRENAA